MESIYIIYVTLGILPVFIILFIFWLETNTATHFCNKYNTFATIPLIIHQTAPKDKNKWHPIWYQCQKSWLTIMYGFEYRMWTDEDINEFVSSRFPNFYQIFISFPRDIYRFDIFRYLVLFEYGGIYADMDFEVYQDFYNMLPLGKVSIAESNYNHEQFQNALMASPPKHPFWITVLQDIIDNIETINLTDLLMDKTVVWLSGPGVLQRAVDKTDPKMVNVLPRMEFSDTSVKKYAAHHSTVVWQTGI